MLPYRPSVHALLSIKIHCSLSLENKLKMEPITNTLACIWCKNQINNE